MSKKQEKEPSLEELLNDIFLPNKDNYPYQGYDALKELEIDALKELRKDIKEQLPASYFDNLAYEEDYKKAYAGYGSITDPEEVILRIKGEDGFSDVFSLKNFCNNHREAKIKKKHAHTVNNKLACNPNEK